MDKSQGCIKTQVQHQQQLAKLNTSTIDKSYFSADAQIFLEMVVHY